MTPTIEEPKILLYYFRLKKREEVEVNEVRHQIGENRVGIFPLVITMLKLLHIFPKMFWRNMSMSLLDRKFQS